LEHMLRTVSPPMAEAAESFVIAAPSLPVRAPADKTRHVYTECILQREESTHTHSCLGATPDICSVHLSNVNLTRAHSLGLSFDVLLSLLGRNLLRILLALLLFLLC
jgi:hypothetical protein